MGLNYFVIKDFQGSLGYFVRTCGKIFYYSIYKAISFVDGYPDPSQNVTDPEH
jgi:hypothetical protein